MGGICRLQGGGTICDLGLQEEEAEVFEGRRKRRGHACQWDSLHLNPTFHLSAQARTTLDSAFLGLLVQFTSSRLTLCSLPSIPLHTCILNTFAGAQITATVLGSAQTSAHLCQSSPLPLTARYPFCRAHLPHCVLLGSSQLLG